MKAMVLRGPAQLELESIERPEPGPDDVLLQVTHGGICGTDLSIYTGTMATEYPKIMGHEVVAEVIQSNDPEIYASDRGSGLFVLEHTR
jgi:threonine dehydrogenase-like Zn-dependent dehydrogenase